ncbi:hypothetical protein D3C71_1927760 [compost metagenome]
MRRRARGFVRDPGACAGERRKREGSARPDQRCAQAAIGHHMLHGFVGIILRDRAIVVVVMGLLLPVECRMRDFLCIGKCGRLPGNGKGLPEHREQQKNESEAPTHTNSLLEALN